MFSNTEDLKDRQIHIAFIDHKESFVAEKYFSVPTNEKKQALVVNWPINLTHW